MYNSRFTYVPANRGTRFGARLIDSFSLIIVILIFVLPLDYFKESSTLSTLFGVLLALVFIAYFIVQAILLTMRGQSLGKLILKIKIIKVDTGLNGGFVANVLLRSVLNYGIASIVPFYGLIDTLFIFENERRCLHDKIASTIVVENDSVVFHEDQPQPVFNSNNFYPNTANGIQESQLQSPPTVGNPYNGGLDGASMMGGMNNVNNPYGFAMQPKKKGLSPGVIAAIVVIPIVIFIVLGIIAIAAFSNIESNSSKKTEITGFANNVKFQVSTPKLWSKSKTNNNEDAQLEIYDFLKNKGFLVIGESKEDFEEGFTVDDYCELLKNSKISSGIIVYDADIIDLTINYCPAKRFQFDSVEDGTTYSYTCTLVETVNGFYQLVGWTNKSSFGKSKNELNQIADSFKEIQTE